MNYFLDQTLNCCLWFKRLARQSHIYSGCVQKIGKTITYLLRFAYLDGPIGHTARSRKWGGGGVRIPWIITIAMCFLRTTGMGPLQKVNCIWRSLWPSVNKSMTKNSYQDPNRIFWIQAWVILHLKQAFLIQHYKEMHLCNTSLHSSHLCCQVHKNADLPIRAQKLPLKQALYVPFDYLSF